MYTWWNTSQPKKKGKMLPFVTTCKELESIMLSETSDEERQISHDFTDMWDIKKLISKPLSWVTALSQ